MRQRTLDVDSLVVETFEPGFEEPVAPASTTYEASLQWCGTSAPDYFCLYECQSSSHCGQC